ncbi:MAG: hypothetical protein AVDCRST_MAG59-1515, partial [uncultured Thermomicrobiales bacterium]
VPRQLRQLHRAAPPLPRDGRPLGARRRRPDLRVRSVRPRRPRPDPV